MIMKIWQKKDREKSFSEWRVFLFVVVAIGVTYVAFTTNFISLNFIVHADEVDDLQRQI